MQESHKKHVLNIEHHINIKSSVVPSVFERKLEEISCNWLLLVLVIAVYAVL